MTDIDKMAEMQQTINRMARYIGELKVAVIELQMWRQTGSIHKQCGRCRQILPITIGGRYPAHAAESYPDGCPGSREVVSG